MRVFQFLGSSGSTLCALALLGLVNTGLVRHAAANDEPEFTTYDTAQHLYCQRRGEVAVDRDPIFRLRVAKTSITEEYSYREGRIGGPTSSFRLRVGGEVSCTVTPSQREDAKPYHKFEGINELSCADNDNVVIPTVLTENLVERGTDKSLIYEYNIHNGPPAKQTVMLSLDGSRCVIRFVRMK